jgi:enamine deaminase RidA (YjgF/YER057c/UK114 family)
MSASRTLVSSGSEFESAVGYSRAVRIGPLVAVAGTTGAGPAGDIAAQTRDALRRIEIALEQAGAALADVVRTRIYVTDISRWREVGEVHAQVFGAIRPVATMVEVSALIAPELMVEIEADAYVEAGAKVPSEPGG